MVATPVVFLPGLLEDADAFEAQCARLREFTACIVAALTGADTTADLPRSALQPAPAGRLALAAPSTGAYAPLEAMRQAPGRLEPPAALTAPPRPPAPR